MFILNITKKNVGPISHEGYWFNIPPGVSAIWDSAGEHITKNLFKIDSVDPDEKKRGAPIPAIISADRKEWKGQYTMVERFKIVPGLIPDTVKLINLAEQRGVDKEKVSKWRIDDSLDPDEIIAAINNLEVPDDVRIPETEESHGTDKEN